MDTMWVLLIVALTAIVVVIFLGIGFDQLDLLTGGIDLGIGELLSHIPGAK